MLSPAPKNLGLAIFDGQGPICSLLDHHDAEGLEFVRLEDAASIVLGDAATALGSATGDSHGKENGENAKGDRGVAREKHSCSCDGSNDERDSGLVFSTGANVPAPGREIHGKHNSAPSYFKLPYILGELRFKIFTTMP